MAEHSVLRKDKKHEILIVKCSVIVSSTHLMKDSKIKYFNVNSKKDIWIQFVWKFQCIRRPINGATGPGHISFFNIRRYCRTTKGTRESHDLERRNCCLAYRKQVLMPIKVTGIVKMHTTRTQQQTIWCTGIDRKNLLRYATNQ